MHKNIVVGYKNPPANTQFRKGTSGNSKGRPKGQSKSKLSDILEK